MKNSNKLHDLCLLPTATVIEAIRKLNDSNRGIILICDQDRNFLGTVTDTDIRSGLALGVALDEAVLKVACLQAIISREGSSRSQIAVKFKKTNLRAIPILSKSGVLVDCMFLDEFLEEITSDRKLLIMAGGFGKRMGELTRDTPKPMLKISGKPMIEHLVEKAAIENFKSIFISTHYLGRKIINFLGDGREYGVQINYINETVPLGTGGSFAELPVSSGPVVVVNADVRSGISFSKLLEFHEFHNATATIGTQKHVIQHPFGVVKSDGIEFSGIIEKPEWTSNINAGIYVLDASVKRLVQEKETISMPEVLRRTKVAGERVIIFPIHETWSDIGSQEQYLNLN